MGKNSGGALFGNGALSFQPSGGGFVFGDGANVYAYGANSTVTVTQPQSPVGPNGLVQVSDRGVTSRVFLSQGATFTTVTSDNRYVLELLPITIAASDTGTVNLSGRDRFYFNVTDPGSDAIDAHGGTVNFLLFNGTGVILTSGSDAGSLMFVPLLSFTGSSNANFLAAGTNDRTVHTHTIRGPDFFFDSTGTLSLGASQSWVDLEVRQDSSGNGGLFEMDGGTLACNLFYAGYPANVQGDSITANSPYFNYQYGANATWQVNANNLSGATSQWWALINPAGSVLHGGAAPAAITSATGGWTPSGGWGDSVIGTGEWDLTWYGAAAPRRPK